MRPVQPWPFNQIFFPLGPFRRERAKSGVAGPGSRRIPYLPLMALGHMKESEPVDLGDCTGDQGGSSAGFTICCCNEEFQVAFS